MSSGGGTGPQLYSPSESVQIIEDAKKYNIDWKDPKFTGGQLALTDQNGVPLNSSLLTVIKAKVDSAKADEEAKAKKLADENEAAGIAARNQAATLARGSAGSAGGIRSGTLTTSPMGITSGPYTGQYKTILGG